MKYDTLFINLPLILWPILILTVSSIPGEQLPEAAGFWQWDKIAHFAEYCIFGLLITRFIRFHFKQTSWNVIVLWVLAALLFAATDEIHQIFIPNRMCTIQDFIADSIGIFTGFFLPFAYRKKSTT